MGLPEAQVQVDANGRPPAPPPPEGSYAAQIRDEVIAAQARLQQAEPASQPPVPSDPPPTPREQLTNDISDKAAERISELVARLREREQEFQQLQTIHKQSSEKLAELERLAEQLRSEREQLRKAQLDSMDPEERARLLGQMQLQEALQQAEQRLLQELQPRLERIDRHELAREYDALAQKYQGGFNPKVHPQLIEQFRAANPNCSVELAFRAVASDEELGVGRARNASPVPPSLAPSHSGIPKSIPTQEVSHPRSTPESEIAEEAAQAFKLLRSKDHQDNKVGMRAIEANLAKRLFQS